MLRAVLYVRVSTKGPKQEPETQLHALREWVRTRGWHVASEHMDRVTGDPVRRGRAPPGLVEALDLVQRRKADVLVIFAADRLVRSPRHLLEMVEHVQRLGGRIASYEDGKDLDTTTDEGELILFLKGWIARMEFKLRRARTIAGLARVRAEGQQLGRPSAKLPDTAEVARRLDAGQSLRQIAHELGDIPVSRVHRVSKMLAAVALPVRREIRPKRRV